MFLADNLMRIDSFEGEIDPQHYHNMHDTPIEKFREALERQRQSPPSSAKGTFFDLPSPSRLCNQDNAINLSVDSESEMDLHRSPTRSASNVLERLLTTRFDHNADRSRFPFNSNIYLAPYGPCGIPSPHELNVARAYELSFNSISFFFPLAFTKDLMAIRIGDGRQSIDVCGKIISQTTVETREFGPTNLIECQFIGRLYLG